MSRALYHLSYGTVQAGPELGALKEKILSGGLCPRLELALLHASLGQRHSLPLVQAFSSIDSEQSTAGSMVGSRLVAEVGFEPTTFGL